MTYCVGLFLRDGLVMLGDTRTNAGVDNVSTFSKIYTTGAEGERSLCLLSAGNLGVTQAVWNRLQEGVVHEGETLTLKTVPSLFRAAQLVGAAIRAVYAADGPALKSQGLSFSASFLLGGQMKDGPHRLYLIYSAGNFIEATPDTPFLQIGEHKYGKPIITRVLTHDTSIEDGVKLVLVSMDDTIRTNLSVGLPLDMLVYRADSLELPEVHRIGADDPYFATLQNGWSARMRQAFRDLPPPEWL
jgi:putative proteasome-type protease